MADEKILLVDDDPDISEVLGLYLKKNGFVVFAAQEGEAALAIVEEEKLDLIILDVVMPKLDGFEICQKIRRKVDVPIFFLSSKDDDVDKIIGLGIGGDDYISKTTSPAVIVAKIKAFLRRGRALPVNDDKQEELPSKAILTFPGLVIDMASAVVKVNDSIVHLSAKEYQILCLLARHPNRVFRVEQLFERIWDEKSLGDHRTVMVHISNLRKKIEKNPDAPFFIKTLRGIGYKFTGH